MVAPFEVRFTFPDGRTAIRKAAAGDVLFSEAVTHATENIGGTDAHGILIELKTEEAVTFIRGPVDKESEIRGELMSLTAPGAFMRFEVWRSPEALERHKDTPHLRASFERRKSQRWMTEITLWRPVPE